ncbi:hypothetical protein I6G79_29520 [Burkholderia plantarii]|nr:hypothetical protein [Burkholderia plantarii]
MENEALDARRRWPLLGMIDPRQTEVAAAAGSPAPAAEGDAGNPADAARPTPAGTRGQDASRNRTHAVLRSTAPLFTRSPRRDVPPVIVKEAAPAAPEGSTYRFSPPPEAPVEDAASPVVEPPAAPAAGTELAPAAAAPTLPAVPLPAIAARFAQPARVTEVPDLSPADAAALAAPRQPVVRDTVPVQAVVPEAVQSSTPATDASSAFARLVSPGLARSASTGIFPAPLGNAQRLPTRQPLGAAPARPTPAPAAAQSSAPSLKKLAGAPAAPARPREAAGAEHGEERLDSLFSRLRRGGAASSPQITVTQPAAAPKAAARRPWFLRGAGQS